MSDAQQQIQTIAFETFERLVYARRYEDALLSLLGLLASIKNNAGFSWFGAAPPLETIYTRICAAITTLFADPQFGVSYDGFVRLMTEHATLHGLYKMSAFRSMDYALTLVGSRDPADPSRIHFSGDNLIARFLATWSFDSEIEVDFDNLSQQFPQWVSSAMIGLLAIGGIHGARAYERKVALAKKCHLLEAAPLHEAMLMAVGDCYMHCSYMDYPEKHEIKRVLNRQLRALVESKMTITERTDLTRKERPTIVIPVEWFGSHHAMYRCYAPSIRQLRTRFKVVGICRPHDTDEQGRSEFDECELIEPGEATISHMAEVVQRHDPDILYYPSIGMASWWVALSNFRLAPIQVMTPGHPATSHSPCIDYIVSDGDLFGDESRYSEKCVHLPVGGARYIKRAGLDIGKARKGQRNPKDPWRLAIPAMVIKLTPPFLRVVQQIYMQANRDIGPTEVHFFPNQAATYNELIGKEMREWIANVKVYPRMEYQPYMEALGQCDLMLSTFPFGGTNSTIDAMLAGLPVVTLEGDEIHSRSDASMIRRVGLPSWLITHSVEEYVRAVMHYLGNGDARWRVLKKLRGADIEAIFYGDGPPEVAGAFVNAFLGIYQRELEARGIHSTAGNERAGDGPGAVEPIVAT